MCLYCSRYTTAVVFTHHVTGVDLLAFPGLQVGKPLSKKELVNVRILYFSHSLPSFIVLGRCAVGREEGERERERERERVSLVIVRW